MGRFFACAGLGVFLTLCASILAIFAHISQINGSLIPRNIRMVNVNTEGLGEALGVGEAIYGSGPREGDAPNTGIRPSYQWGLWGYCAAQSLGGDRDYCVGTSFGFKFQPAPAILFDAPAAQQNTVAQALPSGTFVDSDYLGSYTRGAFYVLFVGTLAGGLAFLIGFLAHRFAFLISAILAFFAFLCGAVGCIIWTVIIHRTRSALSAAATGITVEYGVGLWLYWASTGCLLLAVLPFLIGCIAGRDRY